MSAMSLKLEDLGKAVRYLRLRPGASLLLARCALHNAAGGLLTLVGKRSVRCNLCSWRGARFAAYPDGMKLKRGQRCPRCASSPRYRLFGRYLESRPEFRAGSTVFLEFAPEPCFAAWLRRTFPGFYLTTDLRSPLAAVHSDLMSLALRDGSVDVALCSHVLEHVPDDGAGLREIRRILKPSGWCILLVPWFAGLSATREYGSPNPLEHDHFRRYGEDFPQRVTAAGFRVVRVPVGDIVDAGERLELGLADGEILRAEPEVGPAAGRDVRDARPGGSPRPGS